VSSDDVFIDYQKLLQQFTFKSRLKLQVTHNIYYVLLSCCWTNESVSTNYCDISDV